MFMTAWLIVMIGSYMNVATATGDHLACSLPIPSSLAMAESLMRCPGPSLAIITPVSCVLLYSSSDEKCTGRMYGSDDRSDSDVTVSTPWSATTSKLNSTEQLGQCSSQSQSAEYTKRWRKFSRPPSKSSGIIPRRCAKNSSVMTDVLASMLTRSMASVGTSAIITRRMALATLASVSESSNLMKSSRNSSSSSLGNRGFGMRLLGGVASSGAPTHSD